MGKLATSGRYALSDALVNQRSYVLGLTTILIVVAFVALLQNAVVRSSSVFVRLSETQTGESDIVFLPDLAALQLDSDTLFPPFWINETQMRAALAPAPGFVGTTPRWTLLARALNPENPVRNATMILLIADSQREREIGAGRTWLRRPLEWDETYVSIELLRALGLQGGRGGKITLQFDLLSKVSGIDVSSLVQGVRDTLGALVLGLNTTSGLNQTVNVQALFSSVGLPLPPGFCVSSVNVSALPLTTLCTLSNNTLTQVFLPNATIDVQTLLNNFGLFDNVTVPGVDLNAVPVDSVCTLVANDTLLGLPLNTTVDVSNLTNTACVQGFNLQALPLSQLSAFVAALSPQDITLLLEAQLDALLRPSFNLTVVEGVSGPDGKWPSSLGNVLYLEMSGIPKLVSRMFPQNAGVLQQIITLLDQQGIGAVNITSGTNVSLVSSVNVLNTILGALSSLTAENLPQYALLVVSMIKNRYSIYLQSTEGISDSFTALTNDAFNRLGFNFSAVPTAPVQVALDGILFIKLFLDQIFGSVMAVLVVLGSMLIYALLLGNVSDKTYEYGMLRALGFERTSLIELLLITALYFTIPGIGFGLLAAWVLWVPISVVFQLLTSAPSDYGLEYSAIVLGVVVGIVMPIVANIVPIRRALSRTLRDSLDVYHNVQNETTVTMVKLNNMGLSPWQIVVSIVLVITGFLVYYLIPYAFTYNNFALFLGVLQVILLSMVLGLCLVATTLQPSLERLVLWCLVWGPDAKLLSLMNKNMSAHRSRNRKTALMFTLSLGFIIFAGASFSLQAATVGDTIASFVGADANVFAPSWNAPLPENDLRRVLEEERARNGTKLMGWAFASFQLRGSTQRVIQTRLSNLAGEPNTQISLYGLESNHLDVVYERFYQPSEFDTSISYPSTIGRFPDVVESLYSSQGAARLPVERPPFVVPPPFLAEPKSYDDARLDNRSNEELYAGYVDLIMSEALRSATTVDTKTPLRLFLVIRDADNTDRDFYFLSKARAMCSKLPGFFLSSYRQTATNSPVFVSMDTFANLTDLVDHVYNETQSATSPYTQYRPVNRVIPKENLWLRLVDGASARDVDGVLDRLRSVLVDDRIQVLNVKGLVEATGTASSAMLIFFNVVAVINSVLSFFLLWLSFDANVRYNGWEVGVLRSLGVNAAQVIRVYVYEAVAVVLTAIALGTLVGILVSVVLTLQFNLFLELPFVLYFPVVLFLIVLFLSLALAVLGAYVPASAFAKRSISGVIRGV